MLKVFALVSFLSLSSLAESTRVVDFPNDCLGTHFPCAITHQVSGDWKWGGREFTVSANTSLVLLNKNSLQLISGDLWSADFKDLSVKHGVFQLKASGDLMLNRRDKKLQVVNLNGSVTVDKSGLKNDSIPAGFSNWYEGLAQGGEYRQGVISPWTASDIALLFKRMPGQNELVKSKLAEYKGYRKQAVQESAQLYSKVAEIRRVASENAESAKEARLRKTREEKARIRQMYRDKFYNP